MRKMILMLITLSAIYVFIQILFFYMSKGYEINYVLKKDINFEIKEKYLRNTKNEKNNYYMEISTGNNVFSYQTYQDLNDKKIIKDIKYYKDENMECILPIFENKKVIFDITCNISGNNVYYHNIKEKNSKLKEFASKIDIYDESKFVDYNKKKIEKDLYTIYVDNIVKNHYMAISNYQGITTINHKNVQKGVNVQIFKTDKYTRNISSFVNKYYVTADYDENYEFNKFYLVNIKNNQVKELKSNTNISFDSYIQGSIDEKLYLFDLDNKKQYEINSENSTIKKIGDINGIKKYEDNKWIDSQANDAIKDKVTFIKDRKNDDNIIVDTIGNKKSGFIYTYVKKDNTYELYKSNIQNPNIKVYLFDIDDAQRVVYVDNYLYYIDGDSINYYNEELGIRTLVQSNELSFNNNILYTVTK